MADFRWHEVADYGRAYRRGRSNPLAVAQALLAAVREADSTRPPLRPFITLNEADVLEQAEAAGKRFQQAEQLGPLDGVPVAIKDELDQQGYPTTAGTAFLGGRPKAHDATVVARLRAAGALLLGKANMHEIGLGVTGINPHHGAARNPYDPARITGGSSSGSAACVASGLCPLAIGADGGGSVRIPAALCGVAGLKPTFGRVPETGVFPLCFSVAHVGPLAARVADLALCLQLIAGPDAEDPLPAAAPPLDLSRLDAGVAGLRIGWCEEWNSRASEPLLRACRAAADRLVQAGATLVPVVVERRELVRPVQSVTIGVEMAAAQAEHRRHHRAAYGADTRMLLEMASKISGVEFVQAQRLRSLIAEAFQRAMAEVDLLLTPSTAVTAAPIEADAELAGESDLELLRDLTAFSFAANLTGLPALTVPVGYDEAGLPMGLQFMGHHWGEATLLQAGRAVEADVTARRPAVHFDLIP